MEGIHALISICKDNTIQLLFIMTVVVQVPTTVSQDLQPLVLQQRGAGLHPHLQRHAGC